MEGVAPTLMYDAIVMGEDRSAPLKRASTVKTPSLLVDGGANAAERPFMRQTADALAEVMPHATRRTLEGQTHAVDAKALAPVLIEFFES
jgi:hypothetical protein